MKPLPPASFEFIDAHFQAIADLPWGLYKNEPFLENTSKLDTAQLALVKQLETLGLATEHGKPDFRVTVGLQILGVAPKYKKAVDIGVKRYIEGFASTWLKLPWTVAQNDMPVKPRGVDIFINRDDVKTPLQKGTLKLAIDTGIIRSDTRREFAAQRVGFYCATHPALCDVLLKEYGSQLPRSPQFSPFNQTLR